MIPFTPHLAHECLVSLKCKNIDQWPKVKVNLHEELKFAVQINGKTRDIINIKKDSEQERVDEIIKKSSKANKFLENKKILKIIFVKNKIINYIIK